MTGLEEIQELSRAGNHHNCIEACHASLKVNSHVAFPYKYAGISFLALGDLRKAYQYLLKSHQIDPMDPEIIKDIGNIFYATKDYEEAAKFYNNSIKIDSSYAPAFNNLGLIFKEFGDLNEALRLVKIAINLSSKTFSFYINLGMIYKELGDLQEALTSIWKSIQINPYSPIAYLNLGGIYKDLGNYEQAISCTVKSIDLNHAHLCGDSFMNLSSLYMSNGNLNLALESIQKSAELKPDDSIVYMNMGLIFLQLGNHREALTSTLKSLEINPNNSDACLNLGHIYRILGDLDNSLVYINQSLRIQPDNVFAMADLFELYFDLNLFEKAENIIDKALRLKCSVSERFRWGKAACLFYKQKYEDSIRILETLSHEEINSAHFSFITNVSLKAALYANDCNNLSEYSLDSSVCNREDDFSDVPALVLHRPVEDHLINELMCINTSKLSTMTDARNGNGLCTDFQLFKTKTPVICHLYTDLRAIIRHSLSKEACSFEFNSFFNIFKNGSWTEPHNHVSKADNLFNLWRHKYSLVYYLDPGDQECSNPGFLKMYNPDEQILPSKGMIIILPAVRFHSSFYDGIESRMMLGINFYAFDIH